MIYPEKYKLLLQALGHFENAAVAFSGGVDSTLVLAATQSVMGNKVLAITVKTPYIPDRELEEAIAFCTERGIRHHIIHGDIIPEIRQNPENRCYVCKRHVFGLMKEMARKEGIMHLLDGTNSDDSGVYRPGLAALSELGIKSPLLENGITKQDVRSFSTLLGLPTADKPSYACLLTRLPYCYEVKESELFRIEKAEEYLASIGYAASRVRNHGNIARIEIERQHIPAFAASLRSELTGYFRNLGYEFVTLDLEGFRSGSFDMNKKPTRHES